VETASEPIKPHTSPLPPLDEVELSDGGAAAIVRRPARRARRLSVAARRELLWIAVVYLTARGLLLLTAYLESSLGHHNFLGELAHWDGLWYRQLANHGYPNHVVQGQTTLGFFPLYPICIWLLEPLILAITSHNQIWASTVAGLLVSSAGGLVATVLVHRLADGWWGRAAARRASVMFVVFPGAVVFSMVYSEGILLPLAIGCIYALERRRWLLAGVLAGFGTAVQPVGLLLGLVCLVSALAWLRSEGVSWPAIRRCAVAPLLSATGVLGFLSFLWAWTGSPFANYIAQRHGWSEKTDALALVHLVQRMTPALDPAHFNSPTINLNLVVGIIGAAILAAELALMWRARREISLEACVWTLGITFFACTSEYVPPNPRMLITAFPALMVAARYARGRAFTALVWINGALLVGLSLLTFVGHTLRP